MKNCCCARYSAVCPRRNWQRVVENVNSGLGGDITNLKISDPAATREAFTMSYDVSKVNFLDWSKKKTEIALPLVQFNLPEVGGGDDSDADSEPFKLGPKAEYSYQIKLELPAKYSAHLPLAFSLETRLCGIRSHLQGRGRCFLRGTQTDSSPG